MGVIDPRGTATVLPEQFGKYSLLGHLATGGMAEVWLARQVGMQGFEKIVVIKRARPELTDHGTTRLFLEEARLVATLEHPNIAQVYEIGFVNGSYFFVMEYVDGADLRRLIEAAIAKRQPIALADAVYIISHVCAALHYAHDKHDLEGNPLHIIHRDVSPSNVLLSRDGAVKVCDFGVAKQHNRKVETTQNGVLKGKFSYMSPEQCQSRPIDRRSDVFSIGILLYELTTLTKLFRASSDFALLQQIAEGRVLPPSLRVPEYPPELENIVMKALARDPDERYQSAQALQLDLEEFAREHKLATSSVRIARLMGKLFDNRNAAWIRTQRAQREFVLEGEDNPGESNSMPAFLPDGSEPSLSNGETANERPPPSQASQRAATAASTAAEPAAPHRSAALWLVGAALAGMVAVAVTIADQMMVSAGDRAVASAITADVERISSVLDASARSVRMRADGLATTPMLRAAIETDAATLSDLVNNEMVFTADHGEVLEVYQLRGDRQSAMLRIPRTAAALQPLKGRDAQVRSDGRIVTLAASAPISGYRAGVAGGILLSIPVDLTSIRRALDEHAVHATLRGLGSELVLVGSGDAAGGAPLELAVPSSREWSAEGATLVATPKPTEGLAWSLPVRYMSGGLSALLLLGFVVSLVRRPAS